MVEIVVFLVYLMVFGLLLLVQGCERPMPFDGFPPRGNHCDRPCDWCSTIRELEEIETHEQTERVWRSRGGYRRGPHR